MVMKPECAAAVKAAAEAMGRKGSTDALAREVDARLQRTMRQLARTEEGWQGLSYDERVSMAAERSMQDIQAEAARKVENAQRQILKTAATESRIETQRALFKDETRSGALVRDMGNTGNYIDGIKREAMSHLMSLVDAVGDTTGTGGLRRLSMWLFDADNPQMTRDLAVEVFRLADGSTGNQAAREGAKAWLKVIEDLRTRFNAAGGDVGRLDYGYLPQPHDAARVRAAGRDAWVQHMLGAVDRTRYLDETGARLGDAEVSTILSGAWETISTDGLNKSEPGQFRGTGARANRGSEHRELHFKDADAFLGYLDRYGRGSMYDAMAGHIGGMARSIGLVERYGPNPAAQMRLQFDLASRADGAPLENLPRSFGLRPQSYWETLNGNAASPASARLAQIGQDARNIQVFGKLGAAVISSITDLGTYMVTTGYNRLPYWDAIANIGRGAASKDAREFLTTHGIIAESMAGDLNRWAGENIRNNWSGRIANSTMRLSLMNAWTDTLRRGFSLTMMQGLARLSRTDWAALTEWDRTHLERAGITEADWGLIRRAELTQYGGLDHLTPESIRATGDEAAPEVVAKVLGLITNESEFAVLNPDLATRTIATGGGVQAGTGKGEFFRSVAQFKSFPVAMISRHWRRMLEAPQTADGSPALANRLLYSGALLVTTTALGAIAYQGKQIIAGKDPVDMTGEHAGKFWGKALAQGGGLSIVGDLLLNDPGQSVGGYSRALLGTVAGPTISTAAQALGIGVENAWKAINDKETHAGAESLNLVRQNAPLVNLWYTRAALDHAGMHALQENLSPGYLSKMKQRAAKDWGQDFWWQPGTGAPDRAPDMGKAVGQ